MFPSVSSRDAVNTFHFQRDFEAIGLYDIIMVFNESALLVVDLPCQLHHAWPVVEVGQWRLVINGETRGLGIEDEEHKQLRVDSLELRVG